MDNFTPGKEDFEVSTKIAKINMSLSRLKRRILANVFLVRVVLIGVFVILFLGVGVLVRSLIGSALGNLLFWPRVAATFLFARAVTLDHRENRTNILLLGVGGAGHEAPELTDTMIFVSLDHKGKNPVFLSLPRDIWVPSLRAKINTAYYYGNQKKEGGGLILAKSSVSEILGQPVHYGVALDFSSFSKIIDTVGGIEVDVERTFDDYRYPIPGREEDTCGGDKEFKCRYEHVHFEKGKQRLSGETALKFVRSRNAQGEEGTDFARASRQQKVIDAIKQKTLSPATLINPSKISALWNVVTGSVKTDIPQDKLPIVARMLVGMDRSSIKNVVLDGGTLGDAQNGFLVNPPISAKYDSQWVLIPRDGTWEEVRLWVKDLLK